MTSHGQIGMIKGADGQTIEGYSHYSVKICLLEELKYAVSEGAVFFSAPAELIINQ